MSEKIATTFTINKTVKMDFKIECVRNGVEMGETVEQMMVDYIRVSRQLHDTIKEKHGE